MAHAAQRFVPYKFSESELRRLVIYREAVKAGFYVDDIRKPREYPPKTEASVGRD